MPSIQTITDDHLIDAIQAAKQRVVYVAPGIWPEVAQPLAKAWQRLGAEQVSVILDIDAEVCRFGYGSIDGLNILKKAADHLGQAIGHEPGIRICIVIADEQTFIFSPTPRLIEDEDELEKNESDDLSEAKIFAERKRIEDEFLVHVRGGTVIDRKKKGEFIKQVETLHALVGKFAEHVKESLNDRYLSIADQLSAELSSDIFFDIPPRWTQRLGRDPKPEKLKFLIEDSLRKSFGNPDRRINAMKAEVIFKDVTYDMLNEPEFIATISEHFPDLKHMEDYTAAKESPDSKRQNDEV